MAKQYYWTLDEMILFAEQAIEDQEYSLKHARCPKSKRQLRKGMAFWKRLLVILNESKELKKQSDTKIMKITADYFGLTVNEIKKVTRKEDIRLPRQIAMYLYKTRTHYTLTIIGSLFGKDHATVSHACNAVEDLLDTNYKTVRADVDALRAILN